MWLISFWQTLISSTSLQGNSLRSLLEEYFWCHLSILMNKNKRFSRRRGKTTKNTFYSFDEKLVFFSPLKSKLLILQFSLLGPFCVFFIPKNNPISFHNMISIAFSLTYFLFSLTRVENLKIKIYFSKCLENLQDKRSKMGKKRISNKLAKEKNFFCFFFSVFIFFNLFAVLIYINQKTK